MNIDPHIVTFLSMIVVAVMLIGLLTFLHFSKDNQFTLYDLVLTNDKADLTKVGMLVALLLSSWGFTYLVLADKLTELYLTVYMGTWAASGLLSAYQKKGTE